MDLTKKDTLYRDSITDLEIPYIHPWSRSGVKVKELGWYIVNEKSLLFFGSTDTNEYSNSFKGSVLRIIAIIPYTCLMGICRIHCIYIKR
jgi:hypothetical protein